MNKRTLGDAEEQLAVSYLKQRGYCVIERNYRCKTGEIDIVAKKDGYLVFAEVKYRSDLSYGDPSYAIDKRKQRTIYKTAMIYMLEHHIRQDQKIRFDAVLILNNEIKVIPNAFGAM